MHRSLRLSILLLSLCSITAAAAEPFAKTPTIPKGYDDAIYVAILEKVQKTMPEKDRVPAPLCPDCVASQMWPGMEGTLGSIQLLSPEPPEKVVAFYRSKLADWNHSKDYDFEWIFWKGGESEKNSTMPVVPHVVIRAAKPVMLDQKLFSKMKTQISVFYDPAGGKAAPKTEAKTD